MLAAEHFILSLSALEYPIHCPAVDSEEAITIVARCCKEKQTVVERQMNFLSSHIASIEWQLLTLIHAESRTRSPQ
jgi:hypothetical protein